MATEIEWSSAHEIARRVRAKQLSAADVVEAHLARARATDPKLHAFLLLLEDEARRQAKEVDAAIARGEDPGPLAGVPVALKDNLCTKGIRTTAASKILEGYRPPYDATVVAKLRAAGAIAIGKTNLDEFAMGSSCENSAYGPTRNPWDPTRVPGGSSGGSAAAVASGQATLALGSDTGGSIRQPAAMCGVVGHKPTYGMVSRYGLLAFASSLDQVGPFARDCRDAALLLEAIAGRDPMDATSVAHRLDLSAAKGDGLPLKGVKLALPREYVTLTSDPEVKAALEASVRRFEALGATVSQVHLEATDIAIETYYLIATAEASSNLARYDGVHYGHRTARAESLETLYARSRTEGFGKEVQRRILLGNFVLSSGYYDAYYVKAQRCRTIIQRDLLRALEGHDAMIGPTSPVPAFRIGEKVTDPLAMYACDIFTLGVNLAGLPGTSIPCGFTKSGLPIGLQLVGRAWDDAKLLGIGRSFELASKEPARRPGGLA
jgi:aspartyl-tRNA(Asn)/glutamyl-tRNA(Gln) amidotransferase subunit A